MSVARRKTKSGFTKEYHYAFAVDGKRYRGVCKGCTTKREAEEYEKTLRKNIEEASAQKDVKHLVDHFRKVLSDGKDILLKDAYELSLKKPKKRIPSERLIRAKRSYWLDFVAFLESDYPEIQKLSDVRPMHAEAYIQYLRQNGRFNKTVSYTGTVITKERSYLLGSELSAKTVNTYQQVLSEVFQLLARDAGIVENPFASIPMLAKEAESREAFTEEELIRIKDNMDDFTGPLFIIATATALREGDICTLQWADIDFHRDIITKRMRKTRHIVEIPILPPLKAYLEQLRMNSELASEDYRIYVLPAHAEMYLSNPSGVSYRIKAFLEKQCSIATTKVPDGRSRAVSVKDLHSCRHTFCYYAGLYGIPLSIVQSIVGHMTPEMTKHYSAHASLEAKREKMKQLPSFMILRPSEGFPSINSSAEELRRTLKAKIDLLPDTCLTEILSMIEHHLSNSRKVLAEKS